MKHGIQERVKKGKTMIVIEKPDKFGYSRYHIGEGPKENDYIRRDAVLATFNNAFYAGLAAQIKFIPAEDVLPFELLGDGTLIVSTENWDKVRRVLVSNGNHFCREFYMPEED